MEPGTDNEKIVDEIVEENKMYDMYIPHKPVKLNTGPETIVEQCHGETTNINKIIGRYRRSGVLPERKSPGRYDDVSEVDELLVVKLKMATAMEAYENLPKKITDQFNDVNEFLQYVEGQEQIVAQPVRAAEPAPEPKTTQGDSLESPPKEKPTPPAE